MRRIVSSLIVALLFLSFFVFAFKVQPARAESATIYINPDGSISSPVPANITNFGNVTYTFTGNNYLPIVVNRSNIIINGMGYTLQASGESGFSLSSVNNVTIKNTTITKSWYGIYLDFSSDNNTLVGNNVTANSQDGIDLYSSCDNNTLSDNNVTANSGDGIDLCNSSGNVLSGNKFTANSEYGIDLFVSSDNNTLVGNNVTANILAGIYLDSSSGNVLSGNCIAKAEDGFDGIDLSDSSGNVLSGNNVTANSGDGIYLDFSSDNNTLVGNNVTANSQDGIDLYSSCDNNTLSDNNVTANSEYGIWLVSCDNNTLSSNNVIENSEDGIALWYSSGNWIFHNCFLNNTQQTYVFNSTNMWDDGYPSGGNYWSDYRAVYPNATEDDSSGIWNTPYNISNSNIDRYPLIGLFKTFNAGTWNKTSYSVGIVSNSTITDLSFNPYATPQPTLSFSVTGTSSTMGFCRVAIPLPLMSGVWTVTVNGTKLSPPTLNITIYGNYTYIYFTYHHSTETVQIQSTSAIPEFQPYMLLPLLMIITLLTATVSKRKRNVKK